MSSYDNYTPAPEHRPSGGRRLTRRSHDKVVAGVCGGIADHFGIDATIVRIALVVAVVFGFGSGILLYLLGWWLMPKA